MFRLALITALLLGVAAPANAQVSPPTATTDSISGLSGPLMFRFSAPVLSVTEANVTVGVSGAALLNGQLRCLNGSATVSCNGPLDTVAFYPPFPFVTGETYEAKVNPAGVSPQVHDGVNPVTAYRRLLRAPSSVQEQSPGVRYRWRRIEAGAAGGDSYVTERRAGARAVYRFTGTSVTWITMLGPNQGVASVYIDNRRVATVDTYSSRLRYRIGRKFTGLANRAHTLVVRIDGRAGRGRGAWVALDGFHTSASGTVNESDAAFLWPFVGDSAASASSYATTSTPGAATDFVFKGRGVDWVTHTGPDQGIAKVYIDNKHVKTFDNYSSTRRYGVRRTITNLTDAQHRLAVIVTGTRNRASRGTLVRVDSFVLRAAISDFKGLGAWVDLYDYANMTAKLNDMRSHGVRTLYIQTGRFSTAAFGDSRIGAWLEAAHDRRMKVVGWYLPAYESPVTAEVNKTAAIATFRSPRGDRFDAMGIDIEWRNGKTKNSNGTYRRLSNDEFFAGVTAHLRLVRSRVGVSFPIASIPFAPLDMEPELNGNWGGFPWSSLGRYSDVVMPMSYWTNRYGRCEASPPDTRYCLAEYTRQNISRARALTGLPVHVIGGVMNHPRLDSTSAERIAVRSFIDAAKAERAYGASLYDAYTTGSAGWDEMERASSL